MLSHPVPLTSPQGYWWPCLKPPGLVLLSSGAVVLFPRKAYFEASLGNIALVSCQSSGTGWFPATTCIRGCLSIPAAKGEIHPPNCFLLSLLSPDP